MPSPTSDEGLTAPLERGVDVKVKGERGQFYVLNEKVERDGRVVVTVYGGSGGKAAIRSFYKERVTVRKVRNVSGRL